MQQFREISRTRTTYSTETSDTTVEPVVFTAGNVIYFSIASIPGANRLQVIDFTVPPQMQIKLYSAVGTSLHQRVPLVLCS